MIPAKRKRGSWISRAATLLLLAATLVVLILYFYPVASPEISETQVKQIHANVESWQLGEGGYAAKSPHWEVYFTAPGREYGRETLLGGLARVLIERLDAAERSLWIAVYDLEHPALMAALLRAKERGVALRIVAEHTHRAPIATLVNAGIPVQFDDRNALMHHKFIIIDDAEVWTGSMNLTENGMQRNNNHFLRFQQAEIIQAYRDEFEEMFAGQFGRSSDASNHAYIEHESGEIVVHFIPEFSPLETLLAVVGRAENSIRFLVFSFTLDELGALLIQGQDDGVDVQGVFDSRLARGTGSEYVTLFCKGLPVYLDGNPYTMHHKVFIIDERWVLTGSMNYSRSGSTQNDENWLILQDEGLAAAFLAEYERVFERSRRSTEEDCP